MINQYPLMATSHTFNLHTNYQFSKQHSTYAMSWTHLSLHFQLAPSMYSSSTENLGYTIEIGDLYIINCSITKVQSQVYSCVLFSELHDRSNCQIFIRAVIVSRTTAHKSTSSSCGEKFCFSKNCNNSH